MKKILYVFFCILFFVISAAAVIGFRMSRVKTIVPTKPIFTPATLDFKLDPPHQSLTGKVMRIKGGATQLTRKADDPSIIKINGFVLEGEQITASESGTLDVRFAQEDLFSIFPDTILAFPSTNPKNFLVKQDKGTVEYQTDEQVATISARSLHALFSLSQGKARLSVDPDEKLIDFNVIEGTGRVGYIDTNNQTQTSEIKSGEKIIYDDIKRVVRTR
ncbi:MAG: hypothetical protein ABI425_05160 [Patescibacteria group bacterium]